MWQTLEIIRSGRSHPRGAVDGADNIYIADTNNSTIRKLTLAGSVTTFAGSASPGGTDGIAPSARFFSPWGCALDPSGDLFVADTYNHTIRRVTAAGEVTTFAGTPGGFGAQDAAGTNARFAYPTAVAVGPDGNIYVADYSTAIIRKVTPQTVVTTFAGSAFSTGSADGQGSAARFSNMYGLTVDRQNNVFVADTGNHTIRKITPSGLVSTFAGAAGLSGSDDGTTAARFYWPRGVAADAAGNIYVTDGGNYTIRKITPAGVVSTLAGVAHNNGIVDGAGSAARFSSPQGIAIDAKGTIFVTDNHSIRQITPDANVVTIGGSLWKGGSNEGLGTDARFNFANGLAVDASGKIYLADTSNHSIRVGRPRPVAPLELWRLANSQKLLRGTAPPNSSVQIMAAESMAAPFTALGIVSADAAGIYEYQDAEGVSLLKRCYRSSAPALPRHQLARPIK